MFLTYTAAFGGALALAILAYRGTPVSAFPLPGWAARLHTKGEGMPYGVAIAAGPYLFTRRPLGMRPLPAETPV